MNIFFLHYVPQISALYHCDKHVVKMAVETAQLLATAHHQHGNGANVTYKPTHVNHPSAIWARESRLHYDYLVDLGLALCKEYRRRYDNTHACHKLFVGELQYCPPEMSKLPLLWKDPPQCMPDECKRETTLQGYREYYRYKRTIMDMVWYKNDGSYTPPFMELEHA